MGLRVSYVVGTFSLTLAACVPNAAIYYRPEAEGGMVSSDCAGIPGGIEMQVGGIPFSAYASDTRGEEFARLSLAWKPLTEIQFSSISFSSENFKIRDVRTNSVLDPDRIEVLRDDGSKTATIPYHPVYPQAALLMSFMIWIHLPGRLPEEFELLSPSLIVDGIESDFPVIRFERKVWIGVSPFNC